MRRYANAWGARASPILRFAAVLVSVLALSLVATDPVAAKTAISLDPTAGPPTKPVIVSGGGFWPGETVNVRFDLTKVAAVSATSSGAIHVTFAVPADALPGAHGVKARGKTSGTRAKAPFLVRTNWRQYGFNNARDGANPYENVLGVDDVSGLHELWSLPISGIASGLGNPIVRDGVLYMGHGGLDVFAVDLASHQVLWRGWTESYVYSSLTVYEDLVFAVDDRGGLNAFPAACGSGGVECPRLWRSEDSRVSPYSAPVVDNGVVYVGGGTGMANGGVLTGYGVTAFPAWCGLGGATCEPLWTVDLGDLTSAPALHAGVLYVQTRDEVVAVSIASRSVLWRAPFAPRVSSEFWTTSPAVGDGLVFVSAADHLYAYPVGCATDGSICAPRWVGLAPPDEYPSSTPSVAGGKVFVQTFPTSQFGPGGHVVAFSTTCAGGGATCAPEWVVPHDGADNWQRPAVANGVVYVGGDAHNVIALAANCASGGGTCSPLWTGSLSSRSDGLIVVDGVVYTAEDQWLRAWGL